MSKYNKNNYKNYNEAKNYFRDEAWEYFKKKENIPTSMGLYYFETTYNNNELKEKWGAFRHYYTSAAFTKTYGKNVAKLLGDANEIIQFGSIKSLNSINEYKQGNHPLDRRMDLKNNAEGRKLGSQNQNLELIDEAYLNLKTNKNLILNQKINNDEPFKDNPVMNKIWETADKAYWERKEYEKKPKSILDSFTEHTSNLKSRVDEMFQQHEEKLKRKKQEQKSSGPVHVRAYTKKDGTDVCSHYRSK